MTYHPHYGKTVAERYRLIRRDDPYRPATVALGHARADLDAERAGIGPWPDGMAADPVTVAGETYYVTVDYDIDTRAADFDCYGSIGPSDPYAVERAGYNGPPVDWPEVREGGQTWTYHPGAYYDPDSAARWAWRQGMPRGAVREHLRGELLREGWRLRKHQVLATMFRVVTVAKVEPCHECGDDDAPAWSSDWRPIPSCATCGAVRDVAESSLWGCDGLADGELFQRVTLWWYVVDLAADAAAEAAEKADRRQTALFATTAHG